MARVWAGRRGPHADPEPFEIRTSVGWRAVYVCSLCSGLVLAEDEPGVRHLAFHEQTGTLGVYQERPDTESAEKSGEDR
jgi:hypothetical protein